MSSLARDDKLALGTASRAQDDKGSSTGFLYSAQTGLIDLNKLVKSEARIIEALTINEANEILVVGDLNGKKVHFILRPETQ